MGLRGQRPHCGQQLIAVRLAHCLRVDWEGGPLSPGTGPKDWAPIPRPSPGTPGSGAWGVA